MRKPGSNPPLPPYLSALSRKESWKHRPSVSTQHTVLTESQHPYPLRRLHYCPSTGMRPMQRLAATHYQRATLNVPVVSKQKVNAELLETAADGKSWLSEKISVDLSLPLSLSVCYTSVHTHPMHATPWCICGGQRTMFEESVLSNLRQGL